jgi:hypothetical protein
VSNVERGKSSRRRFMRRVLGLGAAAGAASLTLSSTDRSLIHLAQAGSGTGDTINIDQMNNGVGTTELDSTGGDAVFKVVASRASGGPYGVWAVCNAPDGKAVFAIGNAASGHGYGVFGESVAWGGVAVAGYATASGGKGIGVYGVSYSPDGTSIFGEAGDPGSVPFVAQAASGQTASIQEWQNTSGTPLAVVDASGRLGAGTAAPSASVHGQTSSASGTGVKGYASAINGTNYGVWGQSDSPYGTGVYGWGHAFSGSAYGVIGQTDSYGGSGVYGFAGAGSGGNYGVYGLSSSYQGTGVHGYANAAGGGTYGIYGWAQSYQGTGVYGLASAGSGTTYGVSGYSSSPDGKGVYGATAGSGTNYGVYGYSTSPNGVSILGRAGDKGTVPIVAQGVPGQTGSLQEWRIGPTPLALVDASGNLGLGTTAPARSVHLQGSNACFRMDRNANSSAFILVRTSNTDFNTIWKTFYVGVDASSADNGSFFIGDVHTNVKGASDKRLIIDNAGNIVPPTTSPGSIGTSSLKWPDIWCTTLHQGDLMYENGVRTTEDGDGIAFYNPQGEKIAVLDREGNFYVKGRVVEGLPS